MQDGLRDNALTTPFSPFVSIKLIIEWFFAKFTLYDPQTYSVPSVRLISSQLQILHILGNCALHEKSDIHFIRVFAGDQPSLAQRWVAEKRGQLAPSKKKKYTFQLLQICLIYMCDGPLSAHLVWLQDHSYKLVEVSRCLILLCLVCLNIFLLTIHVWSPLQMLYLLS